MATALVLIGHVMLQPNTDLSSHVLFMQVENTEASDLRHVTNERDIIGRVHQSSCGTGMTAALQVSNIFFYPSQPADPFFKLMDNPFNLFVCYKTHTFNSSFIDFQEQIQNTLLQGPIPF